MDLDPISIPPDAAGIEFIHKKRRADYTGAARFSVNVRYKFPPDVVNVPSTVVPSAASSRSTAVDPLNAAPPIVTPLTETGWP